MFLFLKTTNLVTDWLPLSYTHTKLERLPTIWQNMAVRGIQKFQFSISEKILFKLKLKNPDIPSLSWIRKNWEVQTRATVANPSFQSFCELRKSLKFSLRPTFKNPNFESKDELNMMLCSKFSFTVENKGNLRKSHFKLFEDSFNLENLPLVNNEWTFSPFLFPLWLF